MKAWIPLTLVFALGLAASAQADCTYPRAPDEHPDGNTASKDEMIAAKHDFDRYNGEMNAYLDCIKLEIDAATPEGSSKLSKTRRRKRMSSRRSSMQKNNAAVDELQAVVGHFNEQLKIFKAKQRHREREARRSNSAAHL